MKKINFDSESLFSEVKYNDNQKYFSNISPQIDKN